MSDESLIESDGDKIHKKKNDVAVLDDDDVDDDVDELDDFVEVNVNGDEWARSSKRDWQEQFRGSIQTIGLRAWLWKIFSVRASKFGKHTHYLPSQIFETVTLVLIILNTLMVLLNADPDVSDMDGFFAVFAVVQLTSTIFFTLEYCGRLWSCVETHGPGWRGRLHWAKKPLSVLDLLCLIPFYVDLAVLGMRMSNSDPMMGSGLSILKSIQLVRVLTFLRLERQSKSFSRLRFVFSKKRTELSVAGFLLSVCVLVSGVLFFYAERAAQPALTIFEAMYWSFQTLTTLGVGDVLPRTPGGKLLGSVAAVCGIALFALPAGILGSGFVEILYEERQKRRMMMRGRHKSLGDGTAAADTREESTDAADVEAFPPAVASTAIPTFPLVQITCPCCSHQLNFSINPSTT